VRGDRRDVDDGGIGVAIRQAGRKRLRDQGKADDGRIEDGMPLRRGGGQPLEDDKVKKVIAEAEKELDGKGRLVIRKSGTEPLIRVMAEGEDEAQVNAVVDRICDAVKKAA